MSLYRRILAYLTPHRGLFALAIASMTLFAALDAVSITLFIPLLKVLFAGEGGAASPMMAFRGHSVAERLLDATMTRAISGAPPLHALMVVVVLLLLVFLLKNLTGYVQAVAVATVEARVTRDLRVDIYRHLVRLGLPFFQRTRGGQVLSRFTLDVDQVRQLVTTNLSGALSNTLQVVLYVVVLLSFSWKLTLVALFSIPPMVGLWGRYRKRLRREVMTVMDAVAELSSHLQETLGGIRVLKASGAEEWESQRFEALARRHYKSLVRNERWRRFFSPATEMVTAIAVVGVLWYGGYLVLHDHALDAATFMGFLGMALRLMVPVKWLGNFPATIQPGMAAAERVFQLLDAPIEVVERPGAVAVQGLRDAIRFEGVEFAYGADRPVLHDIDLEIRRGQVVALVGPSGAGKSTLADLVPRFYDPTAGRITLDGHDLRDLRLESLRELLAVVTQETVLFHDTVRGNIAYGRTGATADEVERAARAANAHEFIAQLPEGYDTVLGEKGARLSGGQRQRIAIARALLRNAPVLILDEATSALDTESERLVQQAIEHLMADRTVLVIAHRLSTVRNADVIAIVEGGRIVERGTHDELLAHEGTYRRLYEMQFAVQDGPALTAPAPAALEA
jgi:subfamily B ATP-binding cassette protein MsbA